MKDLAKAILDHMGVLSEGTPVSAQMLLHLATRTAVNQALARQAKAGKLIRLERGLYVRPIESRFGKRPPSVHKVVGELSKLTGETIASHGAVAANAFGLTTQMPMREIYLTSGSSRKLKLGNRSVELRHAPGWQLILAGHPAGDAIRALAWLGKDEVPAALATLSRFLTDHSIVELQECLPHLPTWLAAEIERLTDSRSDTAGADIWEG